MSPLIERERESILSGEKIKISSGVENTSLTMPTTMDGVRIHPCFLHCAQPRPPNSPPTKLMILSQTTDVQLPSLLNQGEDEHSFIIFPSYNW